MALNLKKAARLNPILAHTVGWGASSAQVYALVGFHGTSPGDRRFARALSAWQGTHSLKADGILGPATWTVMQPLLPRPSPSAPPAAPPAPPAAPPRAIRRGKLLASEGDVTAGALAANDAYDLKLFQMSDGSYELVIFMKLQFFFEDGSGGAWTATERSTFMRNWKVAVQGAWSGRRVYTTAAGNPVSVSFEFLMQEGGWMFDHWEIEVTKIPAGSFRTSYVNPTTGNVVLDSEDLTTTPKGHGQSQRGAVHEFGHMLGLLDDYTAGGPNAGDYPSTMNRGETARARYDNTPRSWVAGKLKELGLR